MNTFFHFACYVVVVRFPHGFSVECVLTRRHIVLNSFNLSTALAPLSLSCCFFVSRSYPPSLGASVSVMKSRQRGGFENKMFTFPCLTNVQTALMEKVGLAIYTAVSHQGGTYIALNECTSFKLFLHCNCNAIPSVLLSAHQSLYLDTSAKRTPPPPVCAADRIIV